MTSERRRAPRVKVDLLARWEGDHGREEANVTSLSANGCFVLSGGTFEHKELIRLEILVPNDDPIFAWAEVAEAAGEIGFALRFTSLEAADEARLSKFIQQHLAGKS